MSKQCALNLCHSSCLWRWDWHEGFLAVCHVFTGNYQFIYFLNTKLLINSCLYHGLLYVCTNEMNPLWVRFCAPRCYGGSIPLIHVTLKTSMFEGLASDTHVSSVILKVLMSSQKVEYPRPPNNQSEPRMPLRSSVFKSQKKKSVSLCSNSLLKHNVCFSSDLHFSIIVWHMLV